MTNPRRLLVRGAVGLGALALAFTALMGFAHTPAGRPLMSLVRKAGGCPVPMGKRLTPAEAETIRLEAMEGRVGTAKASARPAFGFVLDETSRAEVEGWAAKVGATCTPDRSDVGLDCTLAPLAKLPLPPKVAEVMPTGRLLFGFNPDRKLVSIQLAARGKSVDDAVAAVRSAMDGFEHDAGPVSVQSGTLSAEYLGKGALTQARAEYRFRNYWALASVTNTASEFAVDLQVQSLPEPVATAGAR